MTQSALEDASLHVNDSAPGLSGSALEALVQEYRAVIGTLERLSRIYPQDITEQFLDLPELTAAALQDEQQVRDWANALNDLMTNVHAVKNANGYRDTRAGRRQLTGIRYYSAGRVIHG